MKKLNFILFFGLLTFTSFSQKNKHYTSYIGVNVQPSHYWLYNKDEFTAPDTEFGVKNDSIFINGFAYGLSYGHFFKKSFGVDVQVLYTKQTQYYNTKNLFTGRTCLQYIKIPIELIRRKELSSDNFLYLKYGIQISYLIDALDYFKTSFDYPFPPEDNLTYINKNNTFYGSAFNPDSDKKYFWDWRYKRFVLGTNLAVGYEHFFSKNISITADFFANIDITNVDNTGSLVYIYYHVDENGNIKRDNQQLNVPNWSKYRYPISGVLQYDRKPSHNIHLGLEFGFKYWFGEKTLILKRKVPREW